MRCISLSLHLYYNELISLQSIYRHWAKDTGFESHLSGDMKAHKVAAATAAPSTSTQSSLNPHLVEKPQVAWIIPYSDALF